MAKSPESSPKNYLFRDLPKKILIGTTSLIHGVGEAQMNFGYALAELSGRPNINMEEYKLRF